MHETSYVLGYAMMSRHMTICFIFPFAPHLDWLSRRICQNTKYADQGAQNFIMPRTFSKVHINAKPI